MLTRMTRPERNHTNAEAEASPAPGSVLPHSGPADSSGPATPETGLRMVESTVPPGLWHGFAYCYPGCRVACYRVDGLRQASDHRRNITMSDIVTSHGEGIICVKGLIDLS
jgi:hypothetical protein